MPPPCQGSTHTSCSAPPPAAGQRVSVGRITEACCPPGARCNYAYVPYTECGYGTCVYGRDPGRCPAPGTSTYEKCADGDPKEKVCLNQKVTLACLMPYPTNYSGPPRNPPFRTCGGDRCTTSQFLDDCFANRAQTKTCAGTWTKVCVAGAVSERCVPEGHEASRFVKCGDGSCAIGDAGACAGFESR